MSREYRVALCKAIEVLETQEFEKIMSVIKDCMQRNSNIYLVGNGGSASLADHFATDWSKGIFEKTQKQCKAISLTSNTSLITALSNDFSYDQIFSKQLSYLANPKDLLFSISGSGNSRNILECVRQAKNLNVVSVGISGFGGGQLAQEVEHSLVVDSFDMQIVEDTFSAIGHAIFKAFSSTSVNQEKRI